MISRMIILGVCAGIALHAQTTYGLRPGAVEVGFGAGQISQSNAPVEDGPKTTLALHMYAGVTPRVSVGLRFTTSAYNNVSFLNTRRYEIGSTLNTTIGEVRYEFSKPARRWAPFLVGGIGGLEFKNVKVAGPDAIELARIIDELRITTGWQLAYTLGAGVNVNITPRLGVELSYRALKARQTNNFYQPTAALYYRF